MDINKQLDRIQKHGFNVILVWNQRVLFGNSGERFHEGFSVKLEKGETWDQCMYRAIMEFDNKYPDLR